MPAVRPVDPPKPVEVRYRGIWVSGHLAAWRKEGDRWLGFVELQVLRGGHWFDQDDVRPCSPSRCTPFCLGLVEGAAGTEHAAVLPGVVLPPVRHSMRA